MLQLRTVLVALVLSLPGLWSVEAAAAPATVTVRSVVLLQDAQGGTTLQISLSGAARRKVFALQRPERLVIDLANTRLGAGVKLPEGVGPVVNVRSGLQPRQTLRLVLQLTAAQRIQTRVESSATRYQLSVDVGRRATSAPAVAMDPSPPPPERAVALQPAHSPGSAGRDIIVAVDAGHGGTDPGAIGRAGTREKDVVLGIARALARRIDAEPGMKAVLTRQSDHFVVLRDRINRARAARADIFVSVHADSIANRDVSGSSVYVLSDRGATNEAARWLAERENAADLKGGVSLGDKNGQLASVLMDLSQTASIGSSMEAAERVLTHLDRVGEVRKSKVQQAGFLVLKSPDIPSMLVETAYISNPGEERRLRTESHQENVAQAIFQGVRDYFRASPPDGSLFAQQRGRGGGAAIIAGAPAP